MNAEHCLHGVLLRKAGVRHELLDHEIHRSGFVVENLDAEVRSRRRETRLKKPGMRRQHALLATVPESRQLVDGSAQNSGHECNPANRARTNIMSGNTIDVRWIHAKRRRGADTGLPVATDASLR